MLTFKSLREALLMGVATFGTTAAVGAIIEPAYAQEVTRTYDIQAQDLNSALREFALQTGRDVLYPPEIVAGKRSNGARGQLTERQALEALLAGTGLRFEQTASNGYAVQDPNSPTQRGDANQEMTNDVEEEIVITGTNLRGVHPDSSAVEIFTNEEIRASGASTTEAFFNQLPQNFALLSGAPALFVGNRGEVNTSAAAGIDLRGLGPGSTLVLINGHRMALSASGRTPDVASIPLAAIDRVDVLSDGASAIYGADAIGGVINFVLNRRFDGAETSASYGGVTSGDLRETHFDQVLGTNWSSGGLLASYSYLNRTALDARDRDFASVSGQFDLFPEDERHSLLLSLSQDLGPATALTADLLYSKRDTHASFNRAFVIPGFLVGSDVNNSDNQLFTSVAVDHDFSSRVSGRLTATIADAQTDESIDTSLFGLVFPFVTESHATTADIQAVINAELMTLPAGVVQLAVGAGSSSDDFEADDHRLARHVAYAFAEANVPLLGPDQRVPLVRRLELNLAGRFSSYSDFGDTFSPRVGLVWGVTDGLNLRGTFSESFKAPFLSQLDNSGNSFYLIDPAVDIWTPDDSSILLFLQGGNPDLEPETAEAFTLGFDFSPPAVEGLTVRGTYFSISYTHRVDQGDPTGGLASLSDPAAFPDLFSVNLTPAQMAQLLAGATITPFSPTFGADPNDPASLANVANVILDNRLRNVGVSEIDGFDLGVDYTFDAWSSRWRVGAHLSRILDSVQRTSPTAPEVTAVDVVLTPVDLRANGYIGFRRGGFDAQLSFNYWDEYADPYSPTQSEVSAWLTVDLTAQHEWEAGPLSGLSIFATVQNLLDEDPPFVALSTPGQGAIDEPLGYDPANASPLGRFVSFGVRKRW